MDEDPHHGNALSHPASAFNCWIFTSSPVDNSIVKTALSKQEPRNDNKTSLLFSKYWNILLNGVLKLILSYQMQKSPVQNT